MADQERNQTAEAQEAENPTFHAQNNEENSYWCYQCNKEVNLEPHEGESQMLCSECNSGFVEAIATAQGVPYDRRVNSRPRRQRSGRADSSIRRNVLRVLRLIAQATQANPRIQRARGARDGTVGETETQVEGQQNSQDRSFVDNQLNLGHPRTDNQLNLGHPQAGSADNLPILGHPQAASADDQSNSGHPQAESADNQPNSGHPQAEFAGNQPSSVHLDASENGSSGVVASEFMEEENEDDDDLNIELDMWDSFEYDDDDDEDDDGDEEDEEENDAWEEVGEGDNTQGQGEETVNGGTVLNSGENNEEINEAGMNGQRRPNARRRDVLRLRIRDWNSLSQGATLETSGRNLDWHEIMQGLEDNTIELRLSLPEEDTYVGNPADYVDDAGYEILLQNFAENDNTHRGAPPAAKSVIEGLPSVIICQEEIDSGAALCAICKDMISLGETGKQLPCQHLYHGECIIPWLSTRNSCPICRYELPTDDADYEDQKKQRTMVQSTNSDSSMVSGEGGLS